MYIRAALFIFLMYFFSEGFCQTLLPLSSHNRARVGPVLQILLEYPEYAPSFLQSFSISRKGPLYQAQLMMLVGHRQECTGLWMQAKPSYYRGAVFALTLDSMRLLLADSTIRYAEVASLAKPLLDISMPAIGMDQIRSGMYGTPLTGKGTLVGLYDSGIDWTHPDFISDTGESRILVIWDQTDTTGVPPAGYTYGSEYTQLQINDELHTHAGHVQGLDYTGHGTHVAGIAAGNGAASGNGNPSGRYAGAAPEANLIVVKGGNNYFIETYIHDGLRYIFQKADEFSMPAVVNLSVGGIHKGPHDGTSPFEWGIDTLLWKQGRAVVIAAGNEGDDAIHFHGEFSRAVQESLQIAFRVPSTTAGSDDYIGIDIWCPSYTDLAFTIVTPRGLSVGPVRGTSSWQTEEGRILVTEAYSPFNDSREMYLWITDTRDGTGLRDDLASGEWRMTLRGTAGKCDGWLHASSMQAYLTNGAAFSALVAEPGNAKPCIAVGSFISRKTWPSLLPGPWGVDSLEIGRLSHFSSPGPSRDNGQKPELTAPGEYILSSYSAYTEPPPQDYWIASDSVHRAWSGTSMAAPHVTGVIALMMEQNPDISSSEIKFRLIQSAVQDGQTGSCWNPFWGFGKLNAPGALGGTGIQVTQPLGNRGLSRLRYYPNPFNSSTTIGYTVNGKGPARISLKLYDVLGRYIADLADESLMPGDYRLSWNGNNRSGIRVPSGVYVLVYSCNGTIVTGKIAVLD